MRRPAAATHRWQRRVTAAAHTQVASVTGGARLSSTHTYAGDSVATGSARQREYGHMRVGAAMCSSGVWRAGCPGDGDLVC